MEEKKMILVTDGYDDKPICVASNTIAARKSALDYLENQYDDGEWEAILEEDGYENRDDLFHDIWLNFLQDFLQIYVKVKRGLRPSFLSHFLNRLLGGALTCVARRIFSFVEVVQFSSRNFVQFASCFLSRNLIYFNQPKERK